MDYETSPTMKLEEEGVVASEEAQSEKTGSEGSDGFVKVDQALEEEDQKAPMTEEVSPEDLRRSVETISLSNPESEKTSNLDGDFAPEKCLRDYYDQLPTETAPFSANDFTPDEGGSPSGDQFVSDLVEPQTDQCEPISGDAAEISNSRPDFTPFDPSFSNEALDNGKECPPETKMSEESKKEVGDDVTQETEEVPMEAAFQEEKSGKDLPELESQRQFEAPGLEEVERGSLESKHLGDPSLEEVACPDGLANEEEIPSESLNDASSMDVPEGKAPNDESSSEQCDVISQSLGGDEEEARPSKKNDPVVDLLFWRDIKLSAFVFTMSLLVLLSLRFFSVLTVIAYLALSLLTVTISIRLYKFVLQTLNGSQQPNPFQQLLDADIALSQEQVSKYVESLLSHLNKTVAVTRDLLLVKSVVASLKFGMLMWLLTYIGCCMNGLTILTTVVLLAFTLPPVYEKYQEPIDSYHALICSKVSQAVATIKSKLPGSKPKTQ